MKLIKKGDIKQKLRIVTLSSVPGSKDFLVDFSQCDPLEHLFYKQSLSDLKNTAWVLSIQYTVIYNAVNWCKLIKTTLLVSCHLPYTFDLHT